jgi:uncharacterized protein
MRPSTEARADRAAALSMAAVAAFNALAFLAFVATLLLAATRIGAAQDAACSGTDLLAGIERDDPALLERIRSEAADTANGSALLWRIEREGAAASHLFGTMHMSDPRVLELSGEAGEAFRDATTVVIETTDVLDEARMMGAILAQPELTMFTDGTRLADLLSPEDRRIVEDGLAARGIPLESVQKMKPWMLAAVVALPACELARKAAGASVLDQKLAEDAVAAGKELAGLETVGEQLSAMASLPIEFHVEGLVETLKLGDRIDDVMETMITLYLAGETGMFWPLFRAVLPAGEAGESGYAAFEEALITTRNRTMAERAAPFLDAGGAFVAVGAMHLPGDDGLVALLRDAGYAVTPVAAR